MLTKTSYNWILKLSSNIGDLCAKGVSVVSSEALFFGDALMSVCYLGNLLALRIKAKSMYRGFFIFLLATSFYASSANSMNVTCRAESAALTAEMKASSSKTLTPTELVLFRQGALGMCNHLLTNRDSVVDKTTENDVAGATRKKGLLGFSLGPSVRNEGHNRATRIKK